MADVAYGSLPFAEQIAFFRRKLNLPTNAWTDIWEQMHDHAFVVAGVNRMDMLQDFRDAVDRAIANGETLEQFRTRFDTIVAKYGWDYHGGRNWRSRVIYETNLRQSYNAGRWQQLQSLKRMRPFWRYRHYDAERYPRPLHESWDNLVLLADDPWWLTHFPANGWGCKCYVEALNQRDLYRLGLKVGTAPPLDMQLVTVGTRGPSPRTVLTPAGVDPGFGYAPGRDAWLQQQAQGAMIAAAASPAIESAADIAEILTVPHIIRALETAYEAFQRDVLATGAARSLSINVGALDPPVVEKLASLGVEPSTAPIAVGDAELLQVLRKAGTTAAPTFDELAQLPTLLAQPRAILLNRTDGTLLYVIDRFGRGQGSEIMVAIDVTQRPNAFSDAVVMDLGDVRDQMASGRLTLLQGSLE